MEWCLVKLGLDLFDALHAYGAGILFAYATNTTLTLWDEGSQYRLCSPVATLQHASLEVLDEIFCLPQSDEVLAVPQQPSAAVQLPVPLSVSNLDGLLAVLFTSPGEIHACSIRSLLRKHQIDSTSVERGITSVRNTCERWKQHTTKQIQNASGWLTEVSEDYDACHPRHPSPAITHRETDITVPMTIDPTLSYASRQPYSDSRIDQKVNMTVRGTRFAPLLACIGAMRFLRAQPAAGNRIVYTVPIASKLTLSRESTRSILWPRDTDVEELLVFQWLQVALHAESVEVQWRGLSYQVLLAQGNKQQAIPAARGSLDVSWLAPLNTTVRAGLLAHWQHLLCVPMKQRPYDVHALVTALLSGQRYAWEDHVADVAQAEFACRKRTHKEGQEQHIRLYHVIEVQEVSALMDASPSTPLSAILARKEGTLRFGHALRQLRTAPASPIRELLDDLASVQTRDELMDLLARMIEVCTVMDAKAYFLIVPSDDDLHILLEDVDRYSARTIAGLLRLLSTLRYPARSRRPSIQHVHGSWRNRVMRRLRILQHQQGGQLPSLEGVEHGNPTRTTDHL